MMCAVRLLLLLGGVASFHRAHPSFSQKRCGPTFPNHSNSNCQIMAGSVSSVCKLNRDICRNYSALIAFREQLPDGFAPALGVVER